MQAGSVPPSNVKVEAEIAATNDRNLPWPAFVAEVKKAVTQFENPVFTEYPNEVMYLPYLDPNGVQYTDPFGNKVVRVVTGKIVIGTVTGQAFQGV